MWIQELIRRFLCRSKYDYRTLWIQLAEIATSSPEIYDLLPKIARLIAHAMSVRQVAVWVRSGSVDKFDFAYAITAHHVKESVLSLRLTGTAPQLDNVVLRLGKDCELSRQIPIRDLQPLYELGVERLLPIQRGSEVIGFLGVGCEPKGNWSTQDDQFLLSVSTQITHMILRQELSREVLIAKEWDSFNRCASFLLHDLKNLATIQSMTLENAENLRHNPDFVTDAFTTFNHTTEKIINLIASLSIQRGQFSLKQQPVNILELISRTFDELKIGQRNGLRIRTEFPRPEKIRAIRGDPELLEKAFTNIILNAIQSLPSGEGEIDVTVSHDGQETITTSIRDTGCGIPPDRLQTMFRPFQTTKENGLGIGLCHTRSIIEVHGGEIRIKSELNAGTTVEIDLPTR